MDAELRSVGELRFTEMQIVLDFKDSGNYHCSLRLVRNVFWMVAVLMLFALPARTGAEQVYRVRKNDTLSVIAQRHGVSVSILARYNGLKDPDKIYVGQSLRIPSSEQGPAILEASVRRALDRGRVVSGRWKYIVIHHSATPMGSAAGFDRYHREERHMENGLAYHFVIGNGRGMGDGEIAVGERWKEQLDGGHLSSYSLNQKSLGICLVGNFDRNRPTRKQMESLRALIDYLLDRCHLEPEAVKTHQGINTLHTKCPGRHFPIQAIMDDLRGR